MCEDCTPAELTSGEPEAGWQGGAAEDLGDECCFARPGHRRGVTRATL